MSHIVSRKEVQHRTKSKIQGVRTRRTPADVGVGRFDKWSIIVQNMLIREVQVTFGVFQNWSSTAKAAPKASASTIFEGFFILFPSIRIARLLWCSTSLDQFDLSVGMKEDDNAIRQCNRDVLQGTVPNEAASFRKRVDSVWSFRAKSSE